MQTKCQIADKYYSYMHEEYHVVSQEVSQDPMLEKFVFMSRSNQLPTLSKKAKWGNEQDPEFTECKICKTGETENQLHVLLLCKHAKKFHMEAAKKIKEYMLSNLKKEVTLPRIDLWGLPIRITQHKIEYLNVQNWMKEKQIELYLGLTGLILEGDTRNFNQAYFKKPYRVLRKLNNIIVKCAKDIWTSRNQVHNVNKTK